MTSSSSFLSYYCYYNYTDMIINCLSFEYMLAKRDYKHMQP